MEKIASRERTLYGMALIIAPLLLATATFFWHDTGEVGLIGGAIQVYACIFWAPALLGLLALVRDRMPGLASWGMLLVVAACVGGVNWGTDGVHADGYRIAGTAVPHQSETEALGAVAPLILYLPGLLFPATIITIGIALLRSKAVPSWSAALLIAGAISFPASRIPRIGLVAHLADLLLFIAAASIGWRMLNLERAARPAIA